MMMEDFNMSGFIAEYPKGRTSEEWIRAWFLMMKRVAEAMGLRINGASLMPDTTASRRIWLHCVPAVK